MREFLKQKSGLIMVIVGSALLVSDLIGINGGISLAIGIILIVEGIDRVKILECKNEKDYLTCSTEIIKDKIDSKEDLLAFSTALVRKLENHSHSINMFRVVVNSIGAYW